MKRTESLYKELKEKIEGLVEFMVSNDLTSADINLELNKAFTLCNVKYKGDDEIKDEFLYLFDEPNNLKMSYQSKLNFIDTNIESNTEEESESKNEECFSGQDDNLKLRESIENNDSLKIKEDVSNDKPKIEKLKVENTKVENTKVEKPNEVNKVTKQLSKETSKKVSEITKSSDTSKDYNKQDKISSVNNTDKNTNEGKDKTKPVINFKEEAIFQREMIINILKEYKLIS